MESLPPHTRNTGLDFARSLAILLVLLAHYSLFFSSGQRDVSALITGSGFLGVELFFILSGFLIGRLLIRDLLQRPTLGALTHFWKRRWYRTLPAYYLVWCALYFLSDHASSHCLHLFMLQNFFPAARDSFFGVSWSLACEEWFYLLTPFLLFLLFKQGLRKHDGRFLLALCLSGLLLAPLLRTLAALLLHYPWAELRKSCFIRLDSFLYGMILAALQHYYPALYHFIARKKRLLFFCSALGLFFCARPFLHLQRLESLFNRSLFFSLTDLSLLPLLILCESSECFVRWGQSWRQKLAYFLSVTSYAVYLIHWDLMVYFRSLHLGAIHYDGSVQNGLIMLSLCLLATYSSAFLIYRFWEKPFMRLRERSALSQIAPLESNDPSNAEMAAQ